jgi:excisionase family DNA binding protein
MEVLLMKVPEAAAALGVSRAKLYELIACGALPAVKVDGCRRVRTDDLVSYVNRLSPTNCTRDQDAPPRPGRADPWATTGMRQNALAPTDRTDFHHGH